jgi:deoxyribonuclease-4
MPKPILGAHKSIAGGFYKAVDAAHRCGCDCVQIFTGAPQQWSVQAVKTTSQSGGLLTKNNNRWRAKEIVEEDVTLFAGRLKELAIGHALSHSSYLINLGSPDDDLWERSIAGMVVELERAEQLGLPYVVMHPGSHTTTTPEEGIARIAAALDEVHQRVPEMKSQILLENTAGQGSNLGWRFEQLAAILAAVTQSERLGVCFDTCHAFAAGYPLADPVDYKATWKEFDKLVGIERIKAIHLNDSKKEQGSRVDRHEHIGRGKLGLSAFANLLADRRFRLVPMYLETPKGDEDGEPLDVINLRILRDLV